MNKLWEILVPVYMDGDRPFTLKTFNDRLMRHPVYTITLEHHHKFDEFVRSRSSGLTIMRSAEGQWVNKGQVIVERMIPVRFISKNDIALEVAQFAQKHYDQDMILCCAISDEIISVDKHGGTMHSRPELETYSDGLGEI